MLDKLLHYLLKLSVFYDLEQSRHKMLVEFYNELQKEKSSQDPVTARTYEDLNQTDRIIVDQFAKNKRKSDNAVYLAYKLNYSYGYIYKRVRLIGNSLKYNTAKHTETLQT